MRGGRRWCRLGGGHEALYLDLQLFAPTLIICEVCITLASRRQNELADLVEQLQADAIDRSVPINDLLRKAKAAAVKLKRADLTQWIEHELSGYPKTTDIPKYRISYPELRFLNPVRGWCPIVGSSQEFRCGQPHESPHF
jgi:AbiTii